jgi:hypothetical protein
VSTADIKAPQTHNPTGHISFSTGEEGPARDAVGRLPQGDDRLRVFRPDHQDGPAAELRIKGSLKKLNTALVTMEDWNTILNEILDEQQMADLKKFGSVDFAYDYDDNTRFRVNLFQARGKLSGGGSADHEQHPAVRGLHLPAGDERDRDAAAGHRAALRRDGLGQVDDDRVDARLRERAEEGAHPDDRGPDRVHLRGQEGDDQPA